MRALDAIKAFAALAAVCLATAEAQAQLAVDKLWVDFEDPRQRAGDVLVVNDSEVRYYITVTPYEILNPGAEDQQRVTSADPDELGLLVTPNRMVLEPGQARAVRILRVDEGLERDRVFRVRIEPALGDFTVEGVVDDLAAGLRVMAAYEVLVTSRPAQRQVSLSSTRDGSMLSISNSGNSNALLFDGRTCPDPALLRSETQHESCTTAPSHRLHAGRTVEIELANAEDAVRYMVQETHSGTAYAVEY